MAPRLSERSGFNEYGLPMAEPSADDLRWVTLQLLEDARRGGISHWRLVAPVLSNVSQTPAAHASTRPMPRPPVTANLSEATVSAEIMPAPFPVPGVNSLPRSTVSNAMRPFVPLDLTRAEREQRLTALKTCVGQCSRCTELAQTRTQTVFGVGNPEAKLLFVGEAPGADEDRLGEPFVGKAGQLLNDIIKACRLKRDDIYICNVLRCRPPGNRLPNKDEAANCREWLDGQIAIVNPDYIVCWGSCAAQNLLASELAIGKMRGRFYQYGRAKVLCTYHPSYLLRNPAAKKDVWDDMKFLFQDMGVDLTAKSLLGPASS